ncbi:MAG: hypothetical protein HGN29_09345 [Asgard group archaeon]|nr:hypothetical protein [Asgard group archaeon]
MKRIVVIGNAAAGKSNFSMRVNEITNIPVYHLDKILWKKDWERTSEEEFTFRHDEILKEDSWIIDGVAYKSTYPKRFSRADTIIFLDTPLEECKERGLQRMKEDIERPNPYVTEGCRYPLEFIKEQNDVIELFHNEYRKYILEMIEQYKKEKTVILLKTNKDTQNFLETLKN